MFQPATRNVLVAVGLWTCARVIAFLIRVLLIPISNRVIFTGDAGIVASWLWEGFPDVLVAAFAAVTFVWVVETKADNDAHQRRDDCLYQDSNVIGWCTRRSATSKLAAT